MRIDDAPRFRQRRSVAIRTVRCSANECSRRQRVQWIGVEHGLRRSAKQRLLIEAAMSRDESNRGERPRGLSAFGPRSPRSRSQPRAR